MGNTFKESYSYRQIISVLHCTECTKILYTKSTMSMSW